MKICQKRIDVSSGAATPGLGPSPLSWGASHDKESAFQGKKLVSKFVEANLHGVVAAVGTNESYAEGNQAGARQDGENHSGLASR